MSKPTLVMLPGLMCDFSVWEKQTDALSAQAECLVPSYGALDSLEAMARLVLNQAPPRFLLAGHSMGGRVALEIMRIAPERVMRLALLDTGYQGKAAGAAGEAETRQRLTLLQTAYSSGMRVMGLEWVQGMVHPQRLQDVALIDAIIAMIARQTAQHFAAQIRALLNRPDATDVLGTINCPTLLLCGRQDSWSPLERHERMAQLIPGSELQVIEDAGHMSTMEQPASVSAALLRWLNPG